MQKNPPKTGESIAIIETNHGVMKAKLFDQLLKTACQNFIELAKQGKYCNVPFHRVIKDFMIQGGDFTNKNGTGGHSFQGPGTNIGDEYLNDLKHIRGALSWAKTSQPNSIGSQFFIVHPEKGAHFLDHPKGGGPAEGYTVFGQIFEGFEVLDKIANLPTDSGDRPKQEATILKIEIHKHG